MTIFEKIIRREIPAEIVWEDEDVLAFRDVNPQAPVHVLIVPKRVIARLAEATDEDGSVLGKLLLAARKVAEKLVDNKQVFYLDIGPKFTAEDGSLNKDIMYDYLHLTGKGYQIWADAIEPKLKELLGEKS